MRDQPQPPPSPPTAGPERRASFLVELDGKSREQDRWKLAAYSLAAIAFDVADLAVVDPAQALLDFQPHAPLEIFGVASIEEGVDAYSTSRPEGTVVVLAELREKRGGLPSFRLDSYRHPSEALYVFGRDRGAGVEIVGDARVYIPAAHSLYGFLTAAIVGASRQQQERAQKGFSAGRLRTRGAIAPRGARA